VEEDVAEGGEEEEEEGKVIRLLWVPQMWMILSLLQRSQPQVVVGDEAGVMVLLIHKQMWNRQQHQLGEGVVVVEEGGEVAAVLVQEKHLLIKVKRYVDLEDVQS
jgi:hypothetical protein